MRTIRFRGRDSNGEWHYGDLEHSPVGKFCRIHEYWDNGIYKGQVDVDPETVGQFTGLCDLHGKEVYEGDIVRFRVSDNRYKRNPRYITKTIRYDNRLARFEADGIFWINLSSDRIEVVGNIHDDKNLLEKGGHQ